MTSAPRPFSPFDTLLPYQRRWVADAARFYGHDRDKRGKLVRVEASFTGRTPTDAEIESAVNAAEQAQKEQAQ